MGRRVKPEQLDSLDPMDPKALASRRDLVLINKLMGNYRWFALALKPNHGTKHHALEFGAGGGELGIYLNDNVEFATYSAVDFAPRPEQWPVNAMWHQGDILHYDHLETTKLLLANLILHHFTDEELDALGKRIQRSNIRHILANEPCRRSFHKWQLWAGSILGFNSVTLYDGTISINAGFKKDELAHKLGLNQNDWLITQTTSFMGAYRMEAHRR